MPEENLPAALKNLPIPALRFFDSLPSTNDEALKWARNDAPDNALVVADHQSSGRGRLGRGWVTIPGSALAFSLVLHPNPSEADRLSLFSPLAALAVCQALEGQFDLLAQIKWPNDVLLNGCKVCGVLAEAVWDGQQLEAVVLGVGINVAIESTPPPDQVRFPATSIEAVFGQPVDRWEFLHAVLAEIQQWRPVMTTVGFIHAWEKRLAFRNEQVYLENTGGERLTGKFMGINEQGNLRLLCDNEEEVQISAGDLSLRLSSNSGQSLGGNGC